MGGGPQEAHTIINHFDTTYGVEDKLPGWQKLCEDVGIPAGPSITQCKKALKACNINIVDFLHATLSGQEVHHFPSKSALRNYTRKTKGKKFPLAMAKENGYIRGLLTKLY